MLQFLSSIFLLIVTFLIVEPAAALESASVRERIESVVLAPDTCPNTPDPIWQRHIVANPKDGYRIRFSRLGCDLGPRGRVLISPGRTESSVEHLETALDLQALGYGPIYVLDQRGQGFSPRILTDPHKGHIEHFADYIDDFSAVVDHIKDGTPPTAPLHVVGSSMGGAIVIGYLQTQGAQARITSAVLLGPMIRVNYFSFVEEPATRLNLAIFSENGALLQARLRCFAKPVCDSIALPDGKPAYSPDARIFRPDDADMMTHSQTRFELRDWLWDRVDWSTIAAKEYESDEIWQGPQVGAPTAQWVLEAAKYNKQMRRQDRVSRMGKVPFLILTGTEDNRAYREHPASTGRAPDLFPHENFCAKVNAATVTGQPICQFRPIPGAFHELLKESDQIRDPVIAQIDGFFAASDQPSADD